MLLPDYPKLEGFEIEAYDEVSEEDGGDINTDITDDDEEWLRKHQDE